jgi:GT2 family glycosyltransferase
MSPLISVIIPTYQRNDLLALCLDRLAPGAQTLPAEQYEVIVTDDGKATTAEALVRETYPWARWVEGPHRGAAANRNSGARHARTEWIVFTDDDCLPDTKFLEAYVKAMRPDTVVYEGKTVCSQEIRPLLHDVPLNLQGGNLWSCNMMVAKKTFEEFGGFEEGLKRDEDIDLRERLKAAGVAFPFIENAIVDHPPRPRRFGKQLGVVHESWIHLWYKAGHREPIANRVLLFIVKLRLRQIIDQFSLPDALILFRSMVEEFFYALKYVRAWEAKYRQEYEGKPPAYLSYRPL